ncbi:hypothetical protein FXO37_10158 [Capsicum annuum]|nr:hypothetical protein FXO37_10158 [Capsicum annuum]
MDEVWINYCGMPVSFGWKEFAVVTGLKCYPPSQVIPILTQKKVPCIPKKVKDNSYDRDDLVSIAWAFEAIPYLRQQVNYQEGVSCPRILRWSSAKIDKNTKFLDLFNPLKDAVINRIKIELFRATAIIRKIILEGGLIVVDSLSGDGVVGGGSGVAVGDNDAPLTVFKANHYEYDHTGYTDFASPREYSACKCQDCRAKHDIVINAINALTASVKELTSMRGLIPSKRILFSSASLDIRVKRRRRVFSKALSSIQKSKIATPLSVCCTEKRTMSKREQHKLKKVDVDEVVAEQH